MPPFSRTWTCTILLLVAAGLFAAPARQSDIPLDLFDLGAPSFGNFSIRDGLPAAIMGGVRVDKEGFVWASSAEGLTRYDGNRWESDGSFATRGVLGTLTTTHDGTLWAAFRDRGIARFDGRRWQSVADFPARIARRVAETADAQGHFTLWALTFDKGLLRFDGTHWSPAPGASRLPRMMISIAATHDLLGRERVWAGSGSQGLWFRDDEGPWQPFRAPGFDAVQIEDLLVTHIAGREQLWISSFGNGLWRLDDTGLRAWTAESGKVPSNEFYSLAQSALPNDDVAVWAASRAGLVRIHGDSARVFDRNYGLPSNVIRDLAVWRAPDGTQILWLATENGIARTTAGPAPWQTISLMGANSSGVFATLAESDGSGGERLWVGAMHDGLGLFEDGEWRHFDTASGLGSPSVRMIKRAPDTDGKDTLWVGQAGGYLLRVLPGPKFQNIRVPWPQTPAQAVTDILGRTFEGQRELWVATRVSGLFRLRAGAWTAVRPAAAAQEWRVTALATQTGPGGSQWLWATSSQGLLRFDGRQSTLLGTEAGLPAGNLSGIGVFEDSGRSVLWIGSDFGIVRVDTTDPGHPRVLPNDLPPSPDPFTYGALRDSRGRIFICTNNGVQRLTPTGHGYSSRVFTRRDGLPHDECNTNAQFVDAHDRYWVGMLGGLGVYDPENEHVDKTPKPLKITAIRLDNAEVSGPELALRPGQNHLTVKFALLSWLNEDKSEFRTQLVGDETLPTPWTHQNVRVFDHLAPGSYSLRVEARDYAGNHSAPVELGIEVQRAWWQDWPARIAFALALAVLAYFLLRWRFRALRKSERQLQAQVEARTAQLNAANERLLELSYLDALTELSNRRKFREAIDAVALRADFRTCSLIFVDVDHFKEYNDRFGHPAGDEALRAVAASMLACAPPGSLVARYGGEEFACLLDAIAIEQAREIAGCMRVSVQESPVPLPGMDTFNRITISIGVAERKIASAEDVHALLRDADAALYRAKDAGRNCVKG
ncbi:MAG: diguanylate cyclase [Proteobacteria bacterium]|nr:diguanylate cyclase [Pseudomonadota bacterium]